MTIESVPDRPDLRGDPMSAVIAHPTWCVGDGRDEYSGRPAVHRSAPREIRVTVADYVTVRMVQWVDSAEPYVVIIGVDCDEQVNLHLPFWAAVELQEALCGLLGASVCDVAAREAGAL